MVCWLGGLPDGGLACYLIVWMVALTDAGLANLRFPDRRGSVAGLACSKSMDGWEAEGGGPPALQVHVSWSLGNCIQLPVRKLDTGREGAKILDQFFYFMKWR